MSIATAEQTVVDKVNKQLFIELPVRMDKIG